MKEIAKRIQEAGGTLYLVGGAIRNELLGVPIIDEDYCITGISKEKFCELFPQAKMQGKTFPVFILNKKEIALARTERKNGTGHKAFEFWANEKITIEQDLARRDVTINSIAKNVLTGELIDPFNGQKDLKNRILRKTTDAFVEDPLRVYRVARFASVLDFKVEPETLKTMEKLKQELSTLSKERVFEEFKKALSSNKPSIFFEVLRQAKVLDVHFQEIAQLIGQTQPQKYHPEGDSYNHTMITVDNSAKLTGNLEVRFSCLVHDLGKGLTPKQMLPHHYGHDEKGVKLVKQLGDTIGVPNAWIKCGKTAAKLHMKAGIFEKMTQKKQVELIENLDSSILGLEGMKIVVACDRARQNKVEEELGKITFASLGKKCLKQINGELIHKKYPKLEGGNFGKKLHEERVKWMKQNAKNKLTTSLI